MIEADDYSLLPSFARLRCLTEIPRSTSRRLEKQKTKFREEKGKPLQKGTLKRGFEANKSNNKPADISVVTKTWNDLQPPQNIQQPPQQHPQPFTNNRIPS